MFITILFSLFLQSSYAFVEKPPVSCMAVCAYFDKGERVSNRGSKEPLITLHGQVADFAKMVSEPTSTVLLRMQSDCFDRINIFGKLLNNVYLLQKPAFTGSTPTYNGSVFANPLNSCK